MATHRLFTPGDPQVKAFFDAVGVDKVYQAMCLNQQCFRARLTPKPWRIGIAAHLKPRPGVWPVAAESRLLRDAWIANYEAASRGYALPFIEALGTGAVHIDIDTVRRLHDEASRALQICQSMRAPRSPLSPPPSSSWPRKTLPPGDLYGADPVG